MKNKKLIIFDLDGTLAKSKSPIDTKMSALLSKLLTKKDVAVISGGAYKQFESQFLTPLKCPKELLKKLYLFPTCSTSFYRYTDKWANVYKEELTIEEKSKIIYAFSKATREVSFEITEKPHGNIMEDRGSQVTFSALGQEAPIDIKQKWDPHFKKRLELKKILENYLPNYEIRVGGTTSVDVTKKGIDKAYGIEQIEKHLGYKKEEMLFIGDALFEGGNDYPVKQTGVYCIETTGPEGTKEIITKLLQ
ncbi:MAG: HAD-IIB family hydrolase [archaeon]